MTCKSCGLNMPLLRRDTDGAVYVCINRACTAYLRETRKEGEKDDSGRNEKQGA